MSKRQVSIFINGRAITNSLKGIRTEKGKINRELQNMVIGSAEYVKKSKEYDTINAKLDKHQKKLRGTSGALGKMTGGLTKFAGIAGIAFGVGEIVQYGKKLFDLGAEMELLGKKALTVFGEALPAVTRAAEENATAMGLTTSEYIDQAVAMGDLLIPMKFTREEAANISTEMVNLSGALSEWTGGQVSATEVSNTLSKALLGEREQLKTLGISIQEADIKARLAEKGLSKLTGTALQQAKAMATLELVMEKSTDAQNAYAENSDTMVRRSAALSAKVSELQEKLATVLIPVFEKLFTIVEGGVDFLVELEKTFERIVDPAKSAAQAFTDQVDSVQELEKNLVPLLDRYDELTAKASLTKAEQEELESIIKKVGDRIPSTVTEFNEYGEALGINAERAREFIASQQALLSVKNADAISAQKDALANLEFQANKYKETLDGVGVGLAGITKRGEEFFRVSSGLGGTNLIPLREDQIKDLRDTFGSLNKRIEGTKLLLAELEGAPSPVAPPVPEESTGGIDLKAEAEAEARAKAQQKAYEKAQKERQKHLEKLAEIIAAANEENALAQLSESERELEEIRIKYQKQIDLATELERNGFTQATAQRKELEALRDQELEAAKQARDAARRERELQAEEELLVEDLERRRVNEERRQELEEEINAKIREVVLSDRELAIIELEEQYEELLAQARLYGIDTLELEITRRKEKERINLEYDAKEKQQEDARMKDRIASAQKGYAALQGLLSTVLNDVLTEQERATGAGKILALVNIGINAAEALSASAATAAKVPFPGNLAAIATSVASVLGVIGQARQVLNATPSVAQRKEGSYFTVQGEDDGRAYRAKHIGSPKTGPLPNYPVLIDSITGSPVLGSERGAEYFVAHHDLQNPAVFRHVSAIEAITRQRVDGGFSTSDGSAPAAPPGTNEGGTGVDAALMAQLSVTLARLNAILDAGILAIIPDDTVLDLNDRFDELNEASGGVLR
jgi:hypothetical protein